MRYRVNARLEQTARMSAEFQASMPTARSIWEELETWSKRFAPWQRLLLAAAVRLGTIPRSTLEQAYSLFLAEHELGDSPEPYPEVPESVTGRAVETSGRARLRRIHSPSGINRLPPSSELTFSDGITIIYGGNAVGKSGFARVLSNACFSRQQHPIYPDVFDDSAPSSPSVKIEVEDEGGVCTTLTFDGDSEHASLKRGFVVFDSAVAQRHLADIGPLGFTPVGFDIFAEMARGYSVLQSRLAADIQRRRRENTFPLAFIGPTTAASVLAANLGRSTDLDQLRALASFGPNERARIEQLQMVCDQLRGRSPEGLAKRLSEVRPQLLTLKEKLAKAREMFSEDNLATDARLKSTFIAVAKEVAERGVHQFGHARLQCVGSSQWEQLIRASQAFAVQQHSKYPEDGDVCLLCHQPLDNDALLLFAGYRQFAVGDGIVALSAAKRNLATRRAEVQALQLDLVKDGTLVYSFLKETHPTTLSAIEKTLDALITVHDSILASLENEAASPASVAIADFDSTIAEIVAVLDRDLALLRQSDVPGSLRIAEGERLELRHREVLSQHLDQMIAFVHDARWTHKAENQARGELNPRHLTEKEQELFATVIAENYRTAFANECVSLSCGVPVEFKTQGRRGQTVRSLVIKDRSPGDILSEGEQKAVALADFLTEVGLNPDNTGIILDDPVTSLDHDRKERIAARLVEEATKRQVIVFTHDMVFFAKLCDAAHKGGQAPTTHWMQRSGDSGLPGTVSLNDAPTTTPQYRSTNFAEESLAMAKMAAGSEQERMVRRGAGQLRRTLEEIVPQFLFKEVVRRWTDRVMVTALKKVNWDNALVDDLVEVFEACSAIMEGHSHTEAGTEAPPTAAKLDELIGKTKELIRRSRTVRA